MEDPVQLLMKDAGELQDPLISASTSDVAFSVGVVNIRSRHGHLRSLRSSNKNVNFYGYAL